MEKTLIFIYGGVASGKYTIAKEFTKKHTKFKLFHNHLVVDLLKSLFEFGDEEFVHFREKYWMDLMPKAISLGQNLVFTFSPENTVQKGFHSRLIQKIENECQGKIYFIKLKCSDEEKLRRVDNSSRKEFNKLTDKELYKQLLQNNSVYDHLDNLNDEGVESNRKELIISTEELEVGEVVEKIWEFIGNK